MIRWARIATLLAALAAVAVIVFDVDPARDLSLAGRALRAGDLDQALRLGSRALYLGSLDQQGQYQARELRAQAALGLGNRGFALAELDRALALRPDSGSGLLLRGRIKLAGGDAAGALQDMDRGLALLAPPGRPLTAGLAAALVQRGLARLALGQMSAAGQDADLAVRLNPRLAQARYLRSRVLDAQGRPAQALQEIEAAFALMQKSPFSTLYLSPEGQEMTRWLVEMRRKNKVDLLRPAPRPPAGR
ncbi:MAG: hypothetical protein C4525_11460 [Desulfarculus sp.]|nr:MAG: hypothetical protein C4525_11460 [Desulfarculus sp.]